MSDGNCPVTEKGCVPFAELRAEVKAEMKNVKENIKKMNGTLEKLNRRFWAIILLLIANLAGLAFLRLTQ